jgi:hypothetical protein
MTMRLTAEDVRRLEDSEEVLVRHQPAIGCDGVDCGTAVADENGDSVSTVPHDFHMIATGRNPATSPRCFAVTP